MYEVYLRAWNSGVNTATIFKSDDLKECENFADKWNAFTDDIYKGKNVDDVYIFFADVYDVKGNRYVNGL